MKSQFLLSVILPVTLAAATGGLATASDIDGRGRSGNPELVAGTNCTTNKTAFVARDDQVSTTSTTFALMPGTRRVVTTSAAGCVIVQFSGELASPTTNDRAYLRAVAHGVGIAQPVEVRAGFSSSAGNFELRSMQFVFASLPAGSYDFRIEWHTAVASSSVASRTLTIQYR
jgi:hypothetical protein